MRAPRTSRFRVASRAARRRRGGLIDEINRLDLAVEDAIADTETPALDRGLAALSRAADYSRLSIASAAALAIAGGPRGRRAAISGLASVAVTATVANAVIKPVMNRRRPEGARGRSARFGRVAMPRSASFPSGHSAAAFAFAAGAGRELPWAAPPLATLAAAVAYSRVHTGVHHTSDVIAGSLLGVALAEATALVLDRFRGGAARGGRAGREGPEVGGFRGARTNEDAGPNRRREMADSVYRVTEVVGVSSDSWEQATSNAVEKVSETVRDLRIAEVIRQDVTIEDGKVSEYRIRLGISFKYDKA